MTDPLEIGATALTLVCVILAVKRSLWQFPTGILGTGLGFFVFWNAGLVSSAILQPIFIAVQVYGWWFWLRGDNSRAPRIRETPLAAVGLACLGAILWPSPEHRRCQLPDLRASQCLFPTPSSSPCRSSRRSCSA